MGHNNTAPSQYTLPLLVIFISLAHNRADVLPGPFLSPAVTVSTVPTIPQFLSPGPTHTSASWAQLQRKGREAEVFDKMAAQMQAFQSPRRFAMGDLVITTEEEYRVHSVRNVQNTYENTHSTNQHFDRDHDGLTDYHGNYSGCLVLDCRAFTELKGLCGSLRLRATYGLLRTCATLPGRSWCDSDCQWSGSRYVFSRSEPRLIENNDCT